MGRELQKRKRRSGVAKVRQNPKSKKQIFGNAFIASQWDSTQTLSQNYRRLGLSSRLNKQTGGIEKSTTTPKPSSLSNETTAKQREDTGRRSDHDRLAINPSGAAGSATSKTKSRRPGQPPQPQLDASAIQEVRIERDPETGRILRVLDDTQTPSNGDTGSSRKMTAAQRTASARFTALDSSDDENENEGDDDEFHGFDNVHAAHGYIGAAVTGASTGDEAVRSLADDVAQQQNESAAAGRRRKQSEGEREWCRRLVAAHGRSDFKAMARDARLNPMQQSVGDVKRRVSKYLLSV